MPRIPPLLEALGLLLLTMWVLLHANGLEDEVEAVISATASQPVHSQLHAAEPFFKSKLDSTHTNTGGSNAVAGNAKSGALGDSSSGLFHFVQVTVNNCFSNWQIRENVNTSLTDLHVSKYNLFGGHIHLLNFLKTSLPMVDPEFVVVTGDLTDAKDAKKLTSMQYEEEWIAYQTALHESGVTSKNNGKFWWDQRGNHDCFNIADWHGKENLFSQYSHIKTAGYRFEYKREFGVYLFVALDGCPKRGPSRPFNFFGVLDSDDLDALQTALDDVPANHTFVLSHYPLSTTLLGDTSNGVSFEDLSKRISVYMCGHLHRLKAGFGHRMYGYKPTGFLELELGDLKLHAQYRIVAVDNDLISFTDVEVPLPQIPQRIEQPIDIVKYADLPVYSARPIILITNPKDSHFFLPERESIKKVLDSTHVRVLVFSQRPVKRVTGVFDKETVFDFTLAQSVSSSSTVNQSPPLWVASWNPKLFHDHRRHKLVVTVEDSEGQTVQSKIRFRLDGKRMELNGGIAEWIILSDFPALMRGVFILGYLWTLLGLLLVPRLWMLYLRSRGKYSSWKRKQSAILIEMDTRSFYQKSSRIIQMYSDVRFSVQAAFLRLCNLTLISHLWWPLYLWMLTLISLPLLFGNLVYSLPFHSQLFYVYGLYIQNRWQPLADTWVFATFEIWNAFLPFTLFVSLTTSSSELFYSEHNSRRTWPLHRRLVVKLIVSMCVMYNMYNKLMLGVFYGWSGWLFSPAVWWSCWMGASLWRWRWRGLVVHGTRRVVGIEHDEREELFDNNKRKDLKLISTVTSTTVEKVD